jgi:hypothetical protein
MMLAARDGRPLPVPIMPRDLDPELALELEGVYRMGDALLELCQAQPDWAAQLRYLKVSGGIGPLGAAGLAELALPTLERLNLLGNELDDRGVTVDLSLASDLPPVQVVDMRQELQAGNRSIFSRYSRWSPWMAAVIALRASPAERIRDAICWSRGRISSSWKPALRSRSVSSDHSCWALGPMGRKVRAARAAVRAVLDMDPDRLGATASDRSPGDRARTGCGAAGAVDREVAQSHAT